MFGAVRRIARATNGKSGRARAFTSTGMHLSQHPDRCVLVRAADRAIEHAKKFGAAGQEGNRV
jgi:hypothetical protein